MVALKKKKHEKAIKFEPTSVNLNSRSFREVIKKKTDENKQMPIALLWHYVF